MSSGGPTGFFSKIYEDEHVLKLAANASHIPYDIYRAGAPHNRTSVLTDAGQTHKVLTALRDVGTTENFFNPMCFRYRFPNISVFPTMSVIAPMQNGTFGEEG